MRLQVLVVNYTLPTLIGYAGLNLGASFLPLMIGETKNKGLTDHVTAKTMKESFGLRESGSRIERRHLLMKDEESGEF